MTTERTAAIAALLRAGRTYAQIRRAVPGASYNLIAQVRRAHNIPPNRAHRPRRSPQDSYRLYATPTEDGHAHWTGPWAGRMPQITIRTGHAVSALRVAFRMHHGREPDGYVRPGCSDPKCVAGDHLTDRRIRHHINQLHRAIFTNTTRETP
ncbi:hypothetical protein [Streptomyces sp. WMMC897]|uniref:hypothetical protein n=1 Tax=Streptomyces sp. WMMC897 TaxID=3014782 RepID=UPI0022B6151B|nr:hypothetical protein [Streptomyces sp. WMMC897]MCZ7414290.1 hypothetical protein [Streptomyces sp. WMMC897]